MLTIEERLDRIEHITAGLAEEHRRDHEENRQRWRDSQRQINELSARVFQMGEELREADRRLERRIEQLAGESRAADKRLEERIAATIPAVGQLTARIGIPPQPPQ